MTPDLSYVLREKCEDDRNGLQQKNKKTSILSQKTRGQSYTTGLQHVTPVNLLFFLTVSKPPGLVPFMILAEETGGGAGGG